MAKQIGDGTLLKAELVTPATFDTITCIFNVTPPGISYETIETEQCLDESGVSASDLGTEQTDEIPFTMAYDPGDSVTDTLRTWALNKNEQEYRLEYSSGYRDKFNAKILSYKGQSITKSDFMRLDVVLLRTGAVTREVTP